ncbi:241a9f7d-5967-47c6-9fca-b8ddf2e97ebe-CDS [Sclerotinia trifoliorum]|uniref:241a9f7d-5967-47c6-9fca-b8ddf2e97ebe-CDS n=1 Tax=Sclerotinia trifoliorum TaxID=28548 RepID=A0A8H2W7C9_9HELO|nr:241a9f7d-5967-47c6-9fca-b8ddf2e97ebe-CDS [Sclerotinia trifoliorum]
MKGCRIFHGRSAGRYLKCSNWNYSTSASEPIAKANDLKNVSSSFGTTDDLNLQQKDNGTQTTEIDGENGEKNGFRKQIKQRELPFSPLMDPSFHEARNRHSAPKPQPSKEERTPFQEQLAKNPYALALTTPVRQCSATQLSLPSFFLQDFTLMAHPTTSHAWHVPRSLSSHSSSLKSSSEEESSVHNPSLGSTTYVAMRQPLFQSFFKKGSGYTGIYKKFGIANAKSIARKHVTLQAVWRPDMDTFLLELMRRRTVELLEYLCSRDNRYIHKCASWERVEWSEQVGCVLWTGQKVISGEGQQGEEQEQEYEREIPPGEFETKRIGPGGRKVVPVFNLRTMMGKHWIQKMREGNRIFENQILVVKHKNATKEIQMKLWKLQGYVATYGGMSDEVNFEKLQRAKKANFKSVDITDSKPKGNFVAFGKRDR